GGEMTVLAVLDAVEAQAIAARRHLLARRQRLLCLDAEHARGGDADECHHDADVDDVTAVAAAGLADDARERTRRGLAEPRAADPRATAWRARMPRQNPCTIVPSAKMPMAKVASARPGGTPSTSSSTAAPSPEPTGPANARQRFRGVARRQAITGPTPMRKS